MRLPPILLLALPWLASAPATFVEHTIASDLDGGYQVGAADLNHDCRPDPIALASGMSELPALGDAAPAARATLKIYPCET